MGNKHSSTKEQRAKKARIKQAVVEERKAQIDQVQQDFLQSAPGAGQMVVSDYAEFIQVTEAAKTQLDRGGAPLTKNDLIAICVALEPDVSSDTLSTLKNSTVQDLNSYIRSIVFDPNRIVAPPRKITNR